MTIVLNKSGILSESGSLAAPARHPANVTAELTFISPSAARPVLISSAVTGSLRAEVVSGDLEIAAGELKEIRLTTVSGDVELRAALAASGRLSAESVSGDLDLRFPASLSAEIEAETFSGDITSPVGKVEKAGFGNGSTLEGRAGSGSARISLETFSGDIEIKLQ